MSASGALAATALVGLAEASGLRRVHVLGWRDLADPEAGGSELHLHEIAQRWAAAGIEVVVRTSAAAGAPETDRRAGYRVIRRGGRLTVFPRAAVAEWTGRHGPRRDALVEIWNGMAWCSPVWARGPKVVWLHHVHGPMWDQTLGSRLGPLGRTFETRIAPFAYRRERIVTLAESSRRELIDELGFSPDRVSVVPPGVSDRFRPGHDRYPDPVVLAVGRLVAVKRFELLIEAMGEVRRSVPGARLVIVGEGYERRRLERLITDRGAAAWVRLAGEVDDEQLLELYQRCWVIASASLAEGWGMTLTEAAACGTPAVATDIVGHRDSVRDGTSGLLVPVRELGSAVARILADQELRRTLGTGARRHAAELTWDRAATTSLALLAEEVHRWRGR